MKASKVLSGCAYNFTGDEKEFLDHLRKALYASKVISYAQGFMLLREAAKVSKGTNIVLANLPYVKSTFTIKMIRVI